QSPNFYGALTAAAQTRRIAVLALGPSAETLRGARDRLSFANGPRAAPNPTSLFFDGALRNTARDAIEPSPSLVYRTKHDGSGLETAPIMTSRAALRGRLFQEPLPKWSPMVGGQFVARKKLVGNG